MLPMSIRALLEPNPRDLTVEKVTSAITELARERAEITVATASLNEERAQLILTASTGKLLEHDAKLAAAQLQLQRVGAALLIIRGHLETARTAEQLADRKARQAACRKLQERGGALVSRYLTLAREIGTVLGELEIVNGELARSNADRVSGDLQLPGELLYSRKLAVRSNSRADMHNGGVRLPTADGESTIYGEDFVRGRKSEPLDLPTRVRAPAPNPSVRRFDPSGNEVHVHSRGFGGRGSEEPTEVTPSAVSITAPGEEPWPRITTLQPPSSTRRSQGRAQEPTG